MFENIKDPYHASLMHVFLVTFGLFRADQPSAVYMDATGRHACLISRRGNSAPPPTPQTSATCARILHYTIHVFSRLCASFQAMRPSFCRRCGRISSFSSNRTRWPCGRLCRAVLGPSSYCGHFSATRMIRGDDLKRLRQANLMGPAGLVSADDSEVMKLSQDGVAPMRKPLA